MKILFDASVIAEGMTHRTRRTGIFRVAQELATAIARRTDLSLTLSAARSWQAVYDLATAEDSRLRPARVISAARGRGAMRQLSRCHAALRAVPGIEKVAALRARTLDRALPPLTASDVARYDVFHLPAHWVPPLARSKTPYVVTIYDIIADTHPEFGNRWSRDAYARLRGSIAPTDFVLTDSAWVKSQVEEYWRIPGERVRVAPLAASRSLFGPVPDGDERRRALRQYGITDEPYLFGVDRPDLRKNVPLLVRAFVDAARDGAGRAAKLVLAGAHHWNPASLFSTEEERRIARDRILRLGYVPDEHLAALYSGARAFVFPSALEGFGLPALEAMQCGTPVIASNTSSLPEVMGDAGILIDPTKREEVSAAMLKLLADDRLRAELSARGLRRAAEFTWERTANETVDCYRAALSP